MTARFNRRGRRPGWAALGAVLVVLVLLAAACGDDTTGTSGSAFTTTTGGDGGTTTTSGGNGGAVPLEGSSSCSDPTGDALEGNIEAEGWPDAFDLTGVEVEVEGDDLVITAHFAADVTQDSRVDLFLGDLSGFSWDGQAIGLDWDYHTQDWAAVVDTLPFTGEIALPVVRAVDNQLVARVPLAGLPRLTAPFQWFAYVGNTDFCPDGNLQGTASNPATFPG